MRKWTKPLARWLRRGSGEGVRVRTTGRLGLVSRSWGSTPCETGAFDVQQFHQPVAAAHDRGHDRAPVQGEGSEGLRPAREDLHGVPWPFSGYGDERGPPPLSTAHGPATDQRVDHQFRHRRVAQPRSADTSSAARTARTSAIAYNSCRNRHCPKCQAAAARQWLEDREAELLPVPYYHVVFTLPAAIGAIAFQNKTAVYDLLFRTAAETLTTIAADPKHLGARIGLTAVLHTWGSALTHHPHVHVIVPGGGLSPDGSRWIACKPGFFLPVRVLSRLFRRLFLDGLAALHAAGRLVFLGDLARLADKAAFDAALAPLRRSECRVGGDVAIPTPHRPGRAGFPHPVLHGRVSLALA